MEVNGVEIDSVPTKNAANLIGLKPEDMTSKDYYFDSYAHFGIHEEMLKVSYASERRK
jgi:hypothetical protein